MADTPMPTLTEGPTTPTPEVAPPPVEDPFGTGIKFDLAPPPSIPSLLSSTPAAPANRPSTSPPPVRGDGLPAIRVKDTVLGEVPEDLVFHGITGEDELLSVQQTKTAGEFQGMMGAKLDPLRKKLASSYTKEAKERFESDNGRIPTSEELRQLELSSERKAFERIDTWLSERRGSSRAGREGGELPFASIVEEDAGHVVHDVVFTIEQLKARGNPLGYALQGIAPLVVATTGAESVVTSPDPLATPQTYNEAGIFGSLDYLFRVMSPTTYLATLADVADVRMVDRGASYSEQVGQVADSWSNAFTALSLWGSEEHLNRIRQGHDTISLGQELNLETIGGAMPAVGGTTWLAEQLGVMSPETRDAIDAAAGGLGIEVLNPLDGAELAIRGSAAGVELGKRATSKALTVPTSPTEKALSGAVAAVEEAFLPQGRRIFQDRETAFDAEAVGALREKFLAEATDPTIGIHVAAQNLMKEAKSSLSEPKAHALVTHLRTRLLGSGYLDKQAKYGKLATEAAGASAAADVAKFDELETLAKEIIEEEFPAGVAVASATAKALPKPQRIKRLERITELQALDHLAAKGRDAVAMADAIGVIDDSITAAKMLKQFGGPGKQFFDPTLIHDTSAEAAGLMAELRGILAKVDDPLEEAARAARRAEILTEVSRKQADIWEGLRGVETKLLDDVEAELRKTLGEMEKAYNKAVKDLNDFADSAVKHMAEPPVWYTELFARESGKDSRIGKVMQKALNRSKKLRNEGKVREIVSQTLDDFHVGLKGISAEMNPELANEVANIATVSQKALAAGFVNHSYKMSTVQGLTGLPSLFWKTVEFVRLGKLEQWIRPQDAARIGSSSRDLEELMSNMRGAANLGTRELSNILDINSVKKQQDIAAAMSLEGDAREAALELANQAAAERLITDVQKYVSANVSVHGSFRNVKTTSLFDGFRHLMKTASRGDEDVFESYKKAVAFSWVPPSRMGVKEDFQDRAGKLINALDEYLNLGDEVLDDGTKNEISFDGMMAWMREKTASILDMDPNSYEFARESVNANLKAAHALNLATAVRDTISQLRRKAMGELSDEAAKAIAGIAHGDFKSTANVAGELIDIYSKLGMDIYESSFREDNMKRLAEIVALYDKMEQTNTVMPRAMLTEMEEKLNGLVKSLEAYEPDNADWFAQGMKSSMMSFWRSWNRAIITGFFLPRPAYVATILSGNFAQVFTTSGVAQAFETSSAGLRAGVDALPLLGRGITLPSFLDTLPGVGGRLAQARAAAARSLGVSEDYLMHSRVGALLDPKTSKFFEADPDAVLHGSVRTYTVQELIEEAASLGVLQTFVGSSNLTSEARRLASTNIARSSALRTLSAKMTHPQARAILETGATVYEKGIENATAFQRNIAQLSDNYQAYFEHMDQTQRVSHWLDLVLDKGKTPEEAARITKEALFDWNSKMTSAEELFAARYAMFWSFQRRAFGQAAQILLEPFTRARKDIEDGMRQVVGSTSPMGALATGAEQSRFSRLRILKDSQKALQTAYREAVEEQQLTDEDKELLRVMPWWFHKNGARTSIGNAPLSPEYKAALERRGIKVTHAAVTIPSLTPVEMTDTLLDLIGLVGVGIYDLFGEQDWQKFQVDAGRLGRKVADMGGPITGEAAGAVLDKFVREEKVHSGDTVAVKRMSDAFLFHALDNMPLFEAAFGDLIHYDRKNPDELRVSSKMMTIYKTALPQLSNDLANWLDPLMGAGAQAKDIKDVHDFLRTSSWFIRQMFGLGKEYLYDPEKVLDYDAKGVKREVDSELRRIKKLRADYVFDGEAPKALEKFVDPSVDMFEVAPPVQLEFSPERPQGIPPL